MKLNPSMTPAENTLYAEALRILPAISAARLQEDEEGLKVLFLGYDELATKLLITPKRTWWVMMQAGISWMTTFVQYQADKLDIEPAAAAQGMILQAVAWTDA